jgi:hypothetical protein
MEKIAGVHVCTLAAGDITKTPCPIAKAFRAG